MMIEYHDHSEVTLRFPMFPGLTQVHGNNQVFTRGITRFEAQKISFWLQKIQSAEEHLIMHFKIRH